MAAMDILAGVAGAAVFTRVMASMLFGVSTTDVSAFSVMPLVSSPLSLLTVASGYG
jgi:hypothetical protein